MLFIYGGSFLVVFEISARALMDICMSSWWDGRTVLTSSVVVVTCATLGTERPRSGLT